jgi:apolipoprotein D and lipocalin family protein
MKRLLSSFSLLLAGCMGMPETVTPVQNFELDQFLGKWYEVARLDHSFERGLSEVSAEYSLKKDGSVKVLNSGYKREASKWKSAEGKASFAEAADQGYLKVSFFGPFYSSYVVFDLGEGYQHAFVSGASTDYLWLLSRTPDISPALREQFLIMAGERGFDTNEVIWVEHGAEGIPAR